MIHNEAIAQPLAVDNLFHRIAKRISRNAKPIWARANLGRVVVAGGRTPFCRRARSPLRWGNRFKWASPVAKMHATDAKFLRKKRYIEFTNGRNIS